MYSGAGVCMPIFVFEGWCVYAYICIRGAGVCMPIFVFEGWCVYAYICIILVSSQ